MTREPPPVAKRPTPPSEAFSVRRAKHQWQWPPGASDRLECAACGSTAEVINLHVGAGVIQSDCLGDDVIGPEPLTRITEYIDRAVAARLGLLYEPTAELTAELSTETLTRITEDLWVNPARVDGAKPARRLKDLSMGGTEDDPTTTALFVGGETFYVALPLHEVVALLNGSA